MTEAQALRRCQNGDREAFRHLFYMHRDLLFRTATLLTGSQDIAEVHVREVLRSAWRGIYAAGKGAPAKPWLIRVLMRHEAARGSVSPKSAVRPSFCAPLRNLPPPLDPKDADRERHRMRQALATLDPASRHVLILRYFADLTIAELALVLDKPEDEVEPVPRQALHKLRVHLQAISSNAPDQPCPYDSDQALVDALRDYFEAAAANLHVPADLWDTLETRAPQPSCVTRIRRKVLATAQRFWTPLAATGGAAALASAVVCATTA